MASKSDIELINNVVNLNNNGFVREQLRQKKYDITKVAWEDTARNKYSCTGNNISDMTLVLAYNKMCLPVIRGNNFHDMTYDVLTDRFQLPVYNIESKTNEITTLSNFIQNIGWYVEGIKTKGSMFLPRDVNVLVSQQVCVLPLCEGSVDFGVQLYNYQSSKNNPAVLTVMVSQQGIAVKTISGKEILHHNYKGNCTWLNATRLEDERKARNEKITKVDSIHELNSSEMDANTILIIQIPLKQKMLKRAMFKSAAADELNYESASVDKWDLPCGSEAVDESSRVENPRNRGMDFAQIKIGSENGEKYPKLTNTLERDPDSPIRITMQGYIVTDTADLTAKQVEAIVEMMQRMEKFAEAKGSLVTANSNRLTEHSNNAPISYQVNPIKYYGNDKPFGEFQPQPKPISDVWKYGPISDNEVAEEGAVPKTAGMIPK